MFIELLVVGAILMYLYSVGFLDFGNPYAIFISIGITVVVSAVAWAVTHFIARRLVDGLFGIDSWSGRAREPRASVPGLSPGDNPALQIPVLEKLAKEVPQDAEFSRRLAQAYWDAGMKAEYERERLRILREGKLSREETCHIYNRLADLAVERGNHAHAEELLQAICDKYPDSVERHNAARRILVVKELLVQHQSTQRSSSA
jgi:hypothetical protein